MSEMMKALVLTEPSKLVYQDVPVPEFAEDEVLVKIKAVAICGSDVHGYDGSSGRRRPPVIMGHEAAGVIEKAGSRVKNFKAGDRVTFDSTIYCGECAYCRAGLINLCSNRTILGVSCADYRRHGCMAEYCNVPERVLYRLPDDVSFEKASLVEPFSIGFHAVSITPVMVGDTALVIGAGTIGQMVIKTLKNSNAARIIVSDLDETKLQTAYESGATHCFGKGADIVKEVMALTGGVGADVSIEAVGVPPTIANAIAATKKNGNLTLIGNVTPQVPIPLQDVIGKQLTIRGSAASCGEYPRCLEAIADGRVDLDNVISRVAPLAEGQEWFDRLHAAEPGLLKVVLIP
ncbi:MAG: galactitol-1-phosphate 5-dehydrogenase [Lachnospiraceae bacterium]|nr:galactitol-1-phosphate 5-dehydrogenase [Lachnospiraceae bacterium]